jgi:hypothetical protein
VEDFVVGLEKVYAKMKFAGVHMAEMMTKENNASVSAFLDSVENEVRSRDCKNLLKLMKQITGSPARMWGDSIVGFGHYHYRYKSGREGDWFVTGFSPRKQDLTIYIMPGFSDFNDQLSRLGKHRTSVSCLYLKKLEDVDMNILSRIISDSYQKMLEIYPSD